MKRSISYGAVVFAYAKCIALLILYFIMTFFLVSIFGMPSLTATLIVDVIMIGFCVWRHLVLKSSDRDADCFKPRFDFSFVKGILCVGLVIAFSFMFLSVMYKTSLLLPDPLMTSRQSGLQDIVKIWGLPFYVFVSCVIAPIAEECMYRLFIYNRCLSVSGIVPAIIFSSLIFGILHGTLLHALFGTLFGIFLVCLYEFSGKHIGICIMAHAVCNFMSVFLSASFVNSSILFFIINTIVLFGMVAFLLWYVLSKGHTKTRPSA